MPCLIDLFGGGDGMASDHGEVDELFVFANYFFCEGGRPFLFVGESLVEGVFRRAPVDIECLNRLV